MTGKNRGKRKADASSSQDSELEVWEETHLSYHLLFSFLFSLSLSNIFLKLMDIMWFYVVYCLIPEQ